MQYVECVRSMYVDVYAEGHLIDNPPIPVYIGRLDDKYFVVINKLTSYPLSVGRTEIDALMEARARLVRHIKYNLVSEAIKLTDDTWNWGDLVFRLKNNEYEFLSGSHYFDAFPFTRVNETIDTYRRDNCLLVFDKCMEFPPFRNVLFCTRGNTFHYFVYARGANYFIVQSPLLIDRINY